MVGYLLMMVGLECTTKRRRGAQINRRPSFVCEDCFGFILSVVSCLPLYMNHALSCLSLLYYIFVCKLSMFLSFVLLQILYRMCSDKT
ncbi:hypothetical protein HanRHA438_Chr10g0474951 [Helianthus annuus]|nr:hypothetical protein HanRHA438_Chr10g0474951 [Helianthus annuus]